jgi:DNA mismatch repair protein MutS2
MNFSTDALEFGRLKQLLARYTSTLYARELLQQIGPSTELNSLESEHAITAEAMRYLREHRVPFNEVQFLAEAMDKLSVTGAFLEIPEIEAIQSFLAQVESLRVRWKEEAEAFPKLAQRAGRLPDLRELAKHLGRAIRNGEVDEKYSPELARIRRALDGARSTVTTKLESMIRNPNYAGQLQDQLVTVRNGRFVIPVRVEQKRELEGIVHGTSSSGATVFMEPLGVLELNNELVRLQEQERYEIARILAELTEHIQDSAASLSAGRSLSGELEVIFAKARFGREFDCTQPRFSANALLSLIKARHPLLEDNLRRQDRAISPVSLDLDATRRILVISGPNAGGKTVVLKTIGLLALMAQSGIPIPADEATLPVFDRILADIGDQQSIMNHLSTFSAHVLTVKSMIESASSQSLILLDEIGSSTEPGEGAALAKSVLERFRKIGALAIATTHYNKLKMYAETTPQVANAAMEFNERTLEPTYKLLHGSAGASSGLKIAERLQMPADVLDQARSFLDTGELDSAYYVDELRRRITDLESEKARLEAERREFEAWRQHELDHLKGQHKEEIARVERRLTEIAKEMSERASRELQAVQDESLKKKYQRKLENVKAHASAQIREEKEKASPGQPQPKPRQPAESVEKGAKVRILSLGVTGSVITTTTSEAEILAGNMRLRRPLTDLEVIEKPTLTLPPGVHVELSGKDLESNEINLLGWTVDEALSRTDKFLDDAFLAHLPQVRIVHGMGTGALRSAISDFLRTHPHVARFEFAPQAEGGRGVTIATLRD